MRNSSLLICILFFALVSSVKGQEAEKETKQKLRFHAVALSVNVMPIFLEGKDRRRIPYELPIGRFQPSVRFCRGTPHQWVEFSLLALLPFATRTVLDTATTDFGLSGRAGTFTDSNIALGFTRGKVSRFRLFRCRIINEVGILANFQQAKFINRKDIFQGYHDDTNSKYMLGLSYTLALRVINKPGFFLDFKVYNYALYGPEINLGFSRKPFRKYLGFERTLLTPQVQFVVPFGAD